jgi:hypothetical protein
VSPGDDSARHARQLLRWYPKRWRDRYGDEFTELLVSEIAERPHSPRRTLDVARAGIVARLSEAGLTEFALAVPGGTAAEIAAGRARQVAASIASLGVASGVFVVIAAAQWSQLLIWWVWDEQSLQRSHARLTMNAQLRHEILGTSAVMIAFLALGMLAALPILATVAKRFRVPSSDGQRRRLAWPTFVLGGSIAALVIGSRALENNWLGTGGLHSPVPGGLAAFIWAVTLFWSTYWGHPAMFAALSPAERDWMTISPLLLAVAVSSAAILIRRAELPPRIAKFEVWLGAVSCVVMTAFLALWGGRMLVDRPPRVSVFQIGTINEVSIGVLALALFTGLHAARVAMCGLRRLGS